MYLVTTKDCTFIGRTTPNKTRHLSLSRKRRVPSSCVSSSDRSPVPVGTLVTNHTSSPLVSTLPWLQKQGWIIDGRKRRSNPPTARSRTILPFSPSGVDEMVHGVSPIPPKVWFFKTGGYQKPIWSTLTVLNLKN